MLRDKHEQCADNQHGTEACAEQIEAIDATDRATTAGQREADARGRKKERYEEHQVEKTQIKELARVPDHFERVKGNTLAEHEAQHHRDTEQQRAHGKCRLESSLQLTPEQCDAGATRAVAEQGEADDHVREVMPLHDRQHAHQQQFVADGACRDEQRCRKQAAIHE